MTGIENYWGFVLAGILLNITPGSDTMYILTRSISQGKSAGIFSVLGIGTGSLVHTLFAALGLSTILATSAIAFTIVKYIGVTYLVYLGVKTLIQKTELTNEVKLKKAANREIYSQGLLTNILNPKVALFFISFLPQFINNETATGPIPFLLLGITFITTGTIWCIFLVIAATTVSSKLRDNPVIEKVMNKITGGVFIGLGAKLALSE